MKKFSVTGFFNKRYVLKETIVATVFTIIITYLVSFIPIKFEFSKAIRQEFLGFDIYDLYYSGRHLNNLQRDSNIVIIEIERDRQAIADQIKAIKKCYPAIVGIDAVFERREDTAGNSSLLEALSSSDSLVFALKVLDTSSSGKKEIIGNFFDRDVHHFEAGHINLAADTFSVVRDYRPFYQVRGLTYPAFSSVIVKKFKPEMFDILEDRGKALEIINYSGNLESYNSLTKEELKYAEITGQLSGLLERKIVLLGYFVRDSPPVLEDLYFSPLNKLISGKSWPDIYGVVIHANIISMVLGKHYRNETSKFKSYLFATLLIFFFLLYMLSQYKKKEHPKHGKFLLIQFLLIICILYIFVQIFNWFHVKVPLLPIMIALVLCVELLGVYKNIALWMHKKYQYKTVFSHKHII